MIAYVKGTVEYTDTNYVVVDNNGFGIGIYVPNSYMPGDNVTIYTYMAVKEDDISLYGFNSTNELHLFKLLITVNGIGPKAALSIMASFSYDTLLNIIASEDHKTLSGAQGIGKKTAEKIIFELKSKISGFEFSSQINDIKENAAMRDAIEGLVAFGYSKAEALSAVKSVENASMLDANKLLSEALKKIR